MSEEKQDTDKTCATTVDLEKRYIQALHEYNEAQDLANEIIGRLALAKDLSVKQVHQQLEIDESFYFR
jgi:hypothetical protein